MSERYSEVRVLSARTDRRGISRTNQVGEGTVLSDDPDNVHISGKDWYGEWPVDETDIPSQRERAEMKRQIAEELERDRKNAIRDVPGLAPTYASMAVLHDAPSAYVFLIEKLTEMGLEWGVENTVLVRDDGSYLRLPSEEEASMDFTELERKGLVKRD